MSRRRVTPLRKETITAEACSPALRLRILRELPFFAELTEQSLERINGQINDLGFEAGEVIARAGGRAERLYIVAAGRVRLYRYTEDGDPFLIDILGTGEFFGGLSGYGPGTNPDTAEALTNLCLLSIDTAHFRSIIATHPSVALRTVEALSARLDGAHEMLRQLSGYSTLQRISYVLLRLARKLGEPDDHGTLIQAPLSREDLAAMAGTTPETASRILSDLAKRRILESGRGWVAIRDRDALLEHAPDFSALD
jgi:CRP-like cAMP-binding protein